MNHLLRIAGLAVLAALPAAAAELPFLHPLFTDHMVFPAGRPAAVWGWSTPGARITVRLAGATTAAVAAADGRWQATLPALAGDGPQELVVEGPGRDGAAQRAVRGDLLLGDVWLCSGQSNMEFGLGGAEGGAAEVAQSESVSDVRICWLGRRIAGAPAALPVPAAGNGFFTWVRPAPGNVGGFPAVGWFAGRTLARELKRPIGLVSCAWSGSNIRGWMSEGALFGLGLYTDELAALRPLTAVEAGGGATVVAQEQAVVDAWWTANDPGTAAGWHKAEQDDAGAPWRALAIPGKWNEDGVTWLRCSFDLPAAAAGQPGRVFLGAISDEEVTWVDGVQVGTTRGWNQPRSHDLPAGILRAGRNVIAIRVLSAGGRGGALGAPGDWRIEVRGAAPQQVSLAQEWRAVASAAGAGLPPKPVLRFQGGSASPTMMFNGGIAPLAPFAFAGVMWYQGEQDAGSLDYRRLLPALVADWRRVFASPRLPFAVVQLPNFHERSAAPVQEPVWFGAVRDAQLATARAVPGVGLAVTTDLGDAGNVHPIRKREVGERLAHAALAAAYGREDGGGPLFAGATAANGAMRVTFTHVHGGLEVRAGEPSGFALAGADGVWHHAVATVDGQAVVVRAADVAAPVAVRYGWAENPPVTLYDRAGMPASPFRSDSR